MRHFFILICNYRQSDAVRRTEKTNFQDKENRSSGGAG
ncbi:Uncharacterized protein dnm_014510 [Desulfonema magnum]|uniref:Uncharacterized protein n=1 Tax=Desulfonema magnum TaxID=45655 RepID=A0A975BHB4_9BACT|nr:Uncharacterized protein dnm_014510 [Desulfonema magnum]